MEPLPAASEFEELMHCGYCKQKFNDTDQSPKLLSCKHYFCLQCMRTTLNKGQELFCVFCWKHTDIGSVDLDPESLPTYTPVLCLAKYFSVMKIQSAASPPPQSPNQHNNTTNSPISPNTNNNNNSNNGGNCSGTTSQESTSTATINTNNSVNSNKLVNGVCVSPNNSAANTTAPPPTTATNKVMLVVSENCHTHAMPLALWCHTCAVPVCRACATTASDHHAHQIKNQSEAKEQLVTEMHVELVQMSKMLGEIQRLAVQQREFLLKILESCVTLKTHIESDLTNNASLFGVSETRDTLARLRLNVTMVESLSDVHNLCTSVAYEKQRLHVRYHEMYVQCQLDELIRNATILFDFQLLKQTINNIQNGGNSDILNLTRILPYHSNSNQQNHHHHHHHNHHHLHHNPVLFLANYCTAQLYSRHLVHVNKQQIHQQGLQQNLHHLHQNNNNNNNNNNGSNSAFDFLPGLYGGVQQQQQQNQQLLLQTLPPHITNITAAQTPKNIYQENNLLIQHQQNSNTGLLHLATPPIQQQQQQQQQQQHSPQSINNHNSRTNGGGGGGGGVLLAAVGCCPLYYFNLEVNGTTLGRVVIEVRADVAPKMAQNFGLLCTGETGKCYKGCQIFQCWEGESVITGDFELNNGRGGRSIFEESYFLPDDTKLMAVRGTVGMRRTQKRHDNLGMVGSQFRIILQEMRGFTGIFGHVIEGLELVEKISTYGDTAGKPTKSILIAKCGKLQ